MSTYKRHRFHPNIISHAVWFYYRFNLSFRDIEDLLAEAGVTVSYEAIRLGALSLALPTPVSYRTSMGFGNTFYLEKCGDSSRRSRLNNSHQAMLQVLTCLTLVALD